MREYIVVDPKERFLSKFEVQPDGCWRWKGKPNQDGYGEFWLINRMFGAHRISYEFFVGPIPRGMQIDHTCHNNDPVCRGGVTCLHRLCVNPEHLEAVTLETNVRRGLCFGALKTHCPKGHPYDETNIYRRRDRPNARECRACRGFPPLSASSLASGMAVPAVPQPSLDIDVHEAGASVEHGD